MELRNELTVGECCSTESGDQLDWVRAHYSWGFEEGITIFGTEQTAKKYYILVGTQEKLNPEASAMLVSDPIQCQEGDGELSFRYWTIPHVDPPVPLSEKTCLFLNCEFESEQTECVERLSDSSWRRSEQPTGNFHTGIRSLKSGAFAFFKGHLRDETPANTEHETEKPTIETTTNHDNYRRKIRETLTDQQQDEKLQTLIETENKKLEGMAARLHFGDFELPRQLILEFCIYMTSEGSRLVVESELRGYCRSTLVEFGQVGLEPHRWMCYRIVLHAGYYKALDFVGYQSSNAYSYIGLDGLKLYELDGQRCACLSVCSTESPPTTTVNTSNPYSTTGCTPQIDSSAYIQQPNTYTLPSLIATPQFDTSSGHFKEGFQQSGFLTDQFVEHRTNSIGSKPGFSFKIIKRPENVTEISDNTKNDNFSSNEASPVAQIPPSFEISKDDTYTPLAQPTPTTKSIRFGGLDDDLQEIDILEELKRLPGKSKRKRLKF